MSYYISCCQNIKLHWAGMNMNLIDLMHKKIYCTKIEWGPFISMQCMVGLICKVPMYKNIDS